MCFGWHRLVVVKLGWAVLWFAQGVGCGTWVSDVLFLAQVVVVSVGVMNSLFQDQYGLLQEII